MEITKSIINESWVYKHKPKKIEDIILPPKLTELLKRWLIIEKKDSYSDFNLPNILLIGTPGLGKTTISKIIISVLGIRPLTINASLFGTLDVLRNQISDFINLQDIYNTCTNNYRKKIIFLDEVDKLTSGFQEGFKAIIEEYHDNVRFICTANINNLSDALISRFQEGTIDFNEEYSSLNEKEIKELKIKIYTRITNIIKEENGTFEPKVISSIVKKYFPDYRRIINVCYFQFLKEGGSVTQLQEVKDVEKIIEILKVGNLEEIKNYSFNSFNIEPLFRSMIEYFAESFKGMIAFKMILTTESYHYKHVNSVIDKQTNLFACLLEISLLLKEMK